MESDEFDENSLNFKFQIGGKSNLNLVRTEILKLLLILLRNLKNFDEL